jgi:hypothetical protein
VTERTPPGALNPVAVNNPFVMLPVTDSPAAVTNEQVPVTGAVMPPVRGAATAVGAAAMRRTPSRAVNE